MMTKQFLAVAAAILAGVDALPCNGCRGCGVAKRDVTAVRREHAEDTGVKFAWLYDLSETGLEKKEIRVVMGVKHGGEYMIKPEGAIGVQMISANQDAAVVGWSDLNENQPWKYYAEHSKDKEEIYYLPKHVDLVWAGLL